MPPNVPEIRLARTVAEESWSEDLLRRAHEALATVQERMGLELDGPVTIRTFRHIEDLQRHLGSRPTHVVAVTRARLLEVSILLPAWQRLPREEQLRTLEHEMVHLLLGRLVRGELPAWLHEGLAMIVSRESGLSHRVRLTAAGALGTLIPLRDLESSVLLGGERQSLAYAQSHAVTKFLLVRSYGGDEDLDAAVRRFAALLVDSENGPTMLSQLRSPLWRDALDGQWRATTGRLWSWISFLAGTSVVWAFTTVLFLLAYWRKRRMTRLIRERFEEEEREAWMPDPVLPDVEPWLEEDDDEPL